MINKDKYILSTAIVSSLIFAFYRYFNFIYYSDLLYGLNIILLGWAWLIGFWYFYNQKKAYSSFILLAIGIFSISINGYHITNFWSITWLICCVFVGYGHLFRFHYFIEKLLRLLGDFSYPLYLLHIPTFALANYFSFPKFGFLYLSMALFFSAFIDICIDKPLKNSYIDYKVS